MSQRSVVNSSFTLPCGCTITHKVAVEGVVHTEEEAKKILGFAAELTGLWVEVRGFPRHVCDQHRPPAPVARPPYERRPPYEPDPRGRDGGQAIQGKPGPVPQNLGETET